ncbi:MAG TPA: hypothetical protein VFG06_11000 [Thermodesulfovibrionales bacterium]|nr:hypothetical protein [Thermodesulfovibrionales bacterium]
MRETIVQTLPCILTREELEERARKLAAANQATGELEKDKKQVGDQFKARQSALESSILMLSGQITTGKEYRPTECEWEFDWTEGVKSLRRTDTMEEIEHKKIAESERQALLT